MSFIIIPMPPPPPPRPAAEAEVLMMMDRAGCVLVGYTARGAAAEANYRRHIRTQRNNNNKKQKIKGRPLINKKNFILLPIVE